VVSPVPATLQFRKKKGTTMKVWIDQDLCTGDGLCEEIAPDVFTLLDDGLAYVVEDGNVMSDPGGAEALANFTDSQLDAVVESAEECPGECIYIEA
jgi:ferredoxin